MGIRHGDLQGMILPLISIDEFEPKSGTDEEIIVVAFFAKDELPAYDLEEFIDKSIVKLLDSETAPNPNEDGYWLVFVEFKRQPNFWIHLFDLAKDIENATGKMVWEVQAYKEDTLYDLKDPVLRQVVPTTEEDYLLLRRETAAAEYFEESMLGSYSISDGTAVFENMHGRIVVEFIDYGNIDRVSKRQALNEKRLDYSATSPKATALRSMLGEGWDVTIMDDVLLVQKIDDSKVVVLK